MKCVLDHMRTVFIHDHDGVHYRYLDNPDYIQFLGDVKGQAASSLLKGLSRERAFALNKEFYYRCGDGSRGFYDIAAAQGHDVAAFRLRLHHEYHRVAYARMKDEYPHWIRPCAQTQHYFARLEGRVRHAILSQGCADNWIKPNLRDLGVLDHFEQVFGYAEVDFQNKAESARPIEMILGAMKASAHEAVFIEDTLKNLARAKERYPDLCTVYICDDKPLEVLPDYVDVQVDTFRRLKQAIYRLHFPEPMPPATSAAPASCPPAPRN